MSEERNIEKGWEDGKSESRKEEVNENISQEQTENLKLQTENMELHHHPDLHHKKKHFKEYFLEFVMIFLAVTLGFFAKSYREYQMIVQKKKNISKIYL
jgi:hypothetical protein